MEGGSLAFLSIPIRLNSLFLFELMLQSLSVGNTIRKRKGPINRDLKPHEYLSNNLFIFLNFQDLQKIFLTTLVLVATTENVYL